ncbi:MAG TPA: hypothetical protein VFF08_01265 [Trueperaceae bacterium]|jgi:hypothetical protein|nr:hypothetical protein [Trueperaceae bacterium]
MDGRPFTYLERMAHDRQRQLIAEAEKLALAKSARRRARRGWRSFAAALGHALVGLGSRLESLGGASRAGRVPAPT